MPALHALLAATRPTAERPLVVVTGAGISAASGIPTFRGPQGYWTVGATEYRPQELATAQAFAAMPREVWRWYLYRRAVCRAAEPNPAHHQLVTWEKRLGPAFALITQNVDGLHTRAGNSAERTYEVHGSVDLMRDLGTDQRLTMDDDLLIHQRDQPLSDAILTRLINPTTGNPCRPHVLWFDESYDEKNYRFDSAMERASRASICVVCGTSGAASAPYLAVESAVDAGAVLIDVSPDGNPFRDLARRYERGTWLERTAVEGLAEIAHHLT